MYFTLFYFYKFNLNTLRFITFFLNTYNKEHQRTNIKLLLFFFHKLQIE